MTFLRGGGHAGKTAGFVKVVNEVVARGFGDPPPPAAVKDQDAPDGVIFPARYLKVRLADGRVVALVSDGSIEAVMADYDHDGEG